MRNLPLKDRIKEFIKHLNQDMDFVMITDRMDESLIILKEYLCWNMTDILYLNRLVRDQPKVSMSAETMNRILKYQVIDDQIFHHFNASFDHHLEKIGREKVASQVKEFRKMREAFENKCFNKNKIVKLPYSSKSWEISDYGKYENLACTFLQADDVEMTEALAKLQLSQDYTVPMIGSDGSIIDHPYYPMQDMISKIQHDYDINHDYPKH